MYADYTRVHQFKFVFAERRGCNCLISQKRDAIQYNIQYIGAFRSKAIFAAETRKLRGKERTAGESWKMSLNAMQNVECKKAESIQNPKTQK